MLFFFFFQAEDGIRDLTVTGVQTCALPISGLDAEQHFLGVSVLMMKIMTIVGGDERNSGLFRKSDQFAIDIFFDRYPLILNFKEEISFPENIAQAVGILARPIVLLIHDRFGHWPAKTGGERNQAFAVFGKQIVVNSGAVVEALKKAGGDQLD